MLSENEIHVWFLAVDEADSAFDAVGDGILSAEEFERAARFRFPRDQRLFRAAHTLLRQTLGDYLGRDPASLTFVVGSHGRPELVGEALRFNLTHTRGMAAVVITGSADCGIDVEHSERSTDIALVSKNVFTDDERRIIGSRPEAEQSAQFFQFWTLKEAYIKARGMGMSLPLREISFSVDGAEPTVQLGAPIQDDGSVWRFWSGRLPGGFSWAVAVKGGIAMQLQIHEKNGKSG